MQQMLNTAGLEAEIDAIIQKDGIDAHTKMSLVRSIKQASFSSQRKNTSIQTILSVSNAMVGTSTLVMAIQYTNAGIASSILVSILIALISSKTSQLCVVHNKSEELDLPETIVRVLGVKWQRVYSISNVLLLYLSGLIYMILICNQIYPLLGLILDKIDVHYAKQTDITFNRISYQWVGLVYFCVIFPLMCLRNLGVILKLVPYPIIKNQISLGIVSVVTFFIFIIFKGLSNMASKGADIFSEVKWFGSDITTIAGVFTMGLMVQSLIVPIMKNNANQMNNNRDIKLAFGWTWFVYQVVGVFGAFAICGVTKNEGTAGDTVLDYFADDWMVVLVQALLFFQLTFVFPVLQYITRAQFFELIYGVQKPPNWQYYGFTVFYALSCLLAEVLEVNLSLIISLCGAIIGLFQIYIIPVLLHMACLYKRRTVSEDNKTLAQIQRESGMTSTLVDTSGYIDNVDLTKLECDAQDLQCNDHREKRSQYSMRSRQMIYCVVLLLGVTVAIAKVIALIIS